MVQIPALGECGALSPLEQHCKHTGDNQGWQQSRKSTSRSSWLLRKDNGKERNIVRL